MTGNDDQSSGDMAATHHGISAPNPTACRLGLLEDHPIVRAGLKQLIEEELAWKVAIESDSAAQFMHRFRPGELDLVITDLSLPDRDGLVVIGQLRALDPHVRLVAFSMHDSPLYRKRVLASGGTELLSKRLAPDLLIERLRGLLPIGNAMAQPWVDGECGDELLASLTPREREVLVMLSRGHSAARTAKALGCAVKTVYVHRANLLRKLSCSNTTQLARVALARSWV